MKGNERRRPDGMPQSTGACAKQAGHKKNKLCYTNDTYLDARKTGSRNPFLFAQTLNNNKKRNLFSFLP
jgi:hypothetical protein